MKIFLLTPIYATTTQSSGATPVVHYFAKEWVMQGNEVHIINLRVRYPRFFYWFSRRFQHQLSTRLGMPVHVEYPNNEDYIADGVIVHRRVMNKFLPHSEYKDSEIRKAVDYISNYCKINGQPDVFVGHWHNPQLKILFELKKRFDTKTALIFHDNKFSLEKIYGDKLKLMIDQIDLIGFRNISAKLDFIRLYGEPKSSFIAYSGVSKEFLDGGKNFHPSFENGVNKFVYVGLLIERKHPVEIVKALDATYSDKPYDVTFIGDGAERINVENARNANSKGAVNFTGRIPRNEVMHHLRESQVFVMISKGEIFGLVYLEAMAFGLIPIGSRNEGIDGIIKDGVNGFLCEAGNEQELAIIIKKIQLMSKDELELISTNAKKTAFEYSDSGVAKHYINCLKSLDEK